MHKLAIGLAKSNNDGYVTMSALVLACTVFPVCFLIDWHIHCQLSRQYRGIWEHLIYLNDEKEGRSLAPLWDDSIIIPFR